MLCRVTFKYNQMMIIQQFLFIYFYRNSTDRNWARNFSLKSSYVGGGGDLNEKF